MSCKIGEILNDGTILRRESDQGSIYLDDEAFNNKKGICYVAELSDREYTYDDFISLAKDDEKIAKILFQGVDWQSPQTLYNEYVDYGELYECQSCKKVYLSHEVNKCPHCGALKIQ